jgi:putative DNA primase/helicase
MTIDLIALANVPASLAERKQWLIWGFRENKNPEKKPIKAPFYASGVKRYGEQGSADDRRRLCTLPEAIKAAQSLPDIDGVGFAFLLDDGLIGIDIDGAIDLETGEISERCQKIIESCDSYTEFSPSGKGVHIIVAGQTKTFKSNDIGLEVFCNAQYFTFTGKIWPGAPLEVRPLDGAVLRRLQATISEAKKAGKKTPADKRIEAVNKSGSLNDFTRVNDAAMGALNLWVPALFPGAVSRGFGFRVSSEALGRSLDEDLSINPKGIVDFGVADMGDAREGKRTPIDLVMEWLPASKPKDALIWLAKRLGLTLNSPPAARSDADARKPDQGYEALLTMPDDIPRVADSISTPPTPDGGVAPYAEWMSEPWLQRTEKGSLKATLHNFEQFLSKHRMWADVLAFDDFSELPVKVSQVLADAPTNGKPEDWTQLDHDRLTGWLSTRGMEARDQTLAKAINIVSHQRAFNGPKDYLESLKWDGVHRAQSWVMEHLGACSGREFQLLPLAERDKIVRFCELASQKWLIGAVRRVFQPGMKMDTMLILEGGQGLGKSTAFDILGGDWYTDAKIDFGNKDSLMILQGRWIIELSEIEALNKSSASNAKQFLAQRVDLFRKPYGQLISKVPRRCVFGGTVNPDTYLKDESGARRFWPIHCCGLLDPDKLREVRDQLWAEAVQLARDGVKHWPHGDEEIALFKLEQDKRFQEDDWQLLVQEFLIGKQRVTSGEVLEALKIDAARWGKPEQMRISSIMRRLEWPKRRAMWKGIYAWCYFNPAYESTEGNQVSEGDDAAF